MIAATALTGLLAACGAEAPAPLAVESSVAAAPVTHDRLPVKQLPPTRLQIADMKIDAKVVPIATDAKGVLTPPSDVSVVGWWAPGARPAGDGSTVLTAHVNDRRQGDGVFSDLANAPIGAAVTVTTGNAELHYKVTSRKNYHKQALPDELFSISGERRLVMITCGGEFDAAAHSYEDNVVVIATPV